MSTPTDLGSSCSWRDAENFALFSSLQFSSWGHSRSQSQRHHMVKTTNAKILLLSQIKPHFDKFNPTNPFRPSMVDVSQERVRSNLRSSMSDWLRFCFNNTSSCLFISMLSITKFVSTDVYMWSFEAAAIAWNRNNQRQDVRVISNLVKWLPGPASFTNMYIQHPRSVLYHCLSLEIVRTQNCRKSLHACAEPYNAIPCSFVGRHMVTKENEQNPFLKSHEVLSHESWSCSKWNCQTEHSLSCLSALCDFCHCSLFSSTLV